MLIDAHCHIDAYPQPMEALAQGEAAGVRTLVVTTSLASYVRARILCRHYPQVQVALGLHPRRAPGYEHWPEWRQLLEGVSLVGEAGLDFRNGGNGQWTAQAQALAEIARACAQGNRALLLHSHHAEAEVWEIVSAAHVRWVLWHGYRPEGPKAVLYRAIEAGHLIGVGPLWVRSQALRQRLRAVPREQVLTESDAPRGDGGPLERAATLRQVLACLAEAWRCTPQEAEAQVERNYARIMADVTAGVGDGHQPREARDRSL